MAPVVFPKTSCCISLCTFCPVQVLSGCRIRKMLSHQTYPSRWAGECQPSGSSVQWQIPSLAPLHRHRKSRYLLFCRGTRCCHTTQFWTCYLKGKFLLDLLLQGISDLSSAHGLWHVVLSSQMLQCWAQRRGPWRPRAIRAHWAIPCEPKWQICRITGNKAGRYLTSPAHTFFRLRQDQLNLCLWEIPHLSFTTSSNYSSTSLHCPLGIFSRYLIMIFIGAVQTQHFIADLQALAFLFFPVPKARATFYISSWERSQGLYIPREQTEPMSPAGRPVCMVICANTI